MRPESSRPTTASPNARLGSQKPRNKAPSKGRSMLNSLKDWVSTSEPSAQAFKKHTLDTHRNAGVSLSDPRASAKLHLPAGRIPEEAIRPSGSGPDPEDLARKKADETRALRGALSGLTLHKMGSRVSNATSTHSTESYASTLDTMFDRMHSSRASRSSAGG